MRIMVVADNASFINTLAAQVRACGHEAYDVRDGAAALAAYSQQPFSMVLVEESSVAMDGQCLIRQLRGLQQGSGWRPIVLIATFTSAEEPLAALDAGCDDILSKPVNAAVLRAKFALFERYDGQQQQLASRNRELQALRTEREEQGRVAEQLMKRLVLRVELDRKVLQHFVRATQQLSGDLFMATSNAVGDRYIMLADATGHGLPAALTQIPLSQTFYAMAARGFSLVSIVAEMNMNSSPGVRNTVSTSG